jgi:hypothetical protein
MFPPMWIGMEAQRAIEEVVKLYIPWPEATALLELAVDN